MNSKTITTVLPLLLFLSVTHAKPMIVADAYIGGAEAQASMKLPEKFEELEQLKQQQRKVEEEIREQVEELRKFDQKINPPPPERTSRELLVNFGAVYLNQWMIYILTQHETIKEHGSWENFFSYPLRPDFDKDTFDYNILKHALSGNYYYLFYRARGYSESEAFAWTFMSSLAFEFAVEAYTEQPSYQDIYQTPIYGTLVGMGSERISKYLFERESTWAHVLGYLFNPFEIFKEDKETDIVAYPQIEKETLGFNVSWRF
jgi:hypothetical protein